MSTFSSPSNIHRKNGCLAFSRSLIFYLSVTAATCNHQLQLMGLLVVLLQRSRYRRKLAQLGAAVRQQGKTRQLGPVLASWMRKHNGNSPLSVRGKQLRQLLRLPNPTARPAAMVAVVPSCARSRVRSPTPQPGPKVLPMMPASTICWPG